MGFNTPKTYSVSILEPNVSMESITKNLLLGMALAVSAFLTLCVCVIIVSREWRVRKCLLRDYRDYQQHLMSQQTTQQSRQQAADIPTGNIPITLPYEPHPTLAVLAGTSPPLAPQEDNNSV